MNITNKIQPILTTAYQKPAIFVNGKQSTRSSRSNSFNQNKLKPLPVVYDSPNHKKNLQLKLTKQETNEIKRENNKKTLITQQKTLQAKDLIYPPPLPAKQFQKVTIKPSNKQFIVNNSRPHSKSSHHRGSSFQNRAQRSISSNYSNFGHQQYNDRKDLNLQRQRTSSSYSSKSSTKIIIETITPLQSGKYPSLIQSVHHKIQTQFNNPRSNYHFQNIKPFVNNHVKANHQFKVQNNFYHSPQPNQQFFHSPTHQFQANQNDTNNRKNTKKVQFSQVFNYPLKKTLDVQNSKILEINQSEVINKNNQHNFNEEKIINYPIPSQIENYGANKKFNERKTFEKMENSTITNNFATQTYKNYQKDSKIEIKKIPVQTITNKQVFNSEEFYESSRKMIDKIFEQQTQKAMLRMRSFDIQKFHSPNRKIYTRNKNIIIEKR